jgi:hypothetical protein
MSNSNAITLTIEVVKSNGIIDRDAIRADAFHQLETALDDQETFRERVAEVVNGVFDHNPPGTRFLLNHLLSKAIEALAVEPRDYGKWEKRVLEYIRDNSQGKIVKGVCERPDSLFVMGKGTKEGGVARRADLDGSVEPKGEGIEPTQKIEAAQLEAAAE